MFTNRIPDIVVRYLKILKKKLRKNKELERESEMNIELICDLERKAYQLRCEIIKMIYRARSGHPGGSLSIAEIMTVLYFHVLRLDPKNPNWLERDRFILSKGHACPAWYACLAMRGFFDMEVLNHLRKIDSPLQGHPDMRKTRGVDMTTGSLGHGLSIGAGMAQASKLDNKDYYVFVLLGDGEVNEGIVWEAAMYAKKYEIDNLIAILDYNRLQLDGCTDVVMPLEPLVAKWESFGWNVLEIDGHNIRQILDAIQEIKNHKGEPSIIIAHTVKGKGVSFMENDPDWHGKAPDDDQYQQAMKELKERAYGNDSHS